MWNFGDLEESGGLGDHVGQALGGRQVLAQVPLVRASQAGFPPAGGTEKTSYSTWISDGFPPPGTPEASASIRPPMSLRTDGGFSGRGSRTRPCAAPAWAPADRLGSVGAGFT